MNISTIADLSQFDQLDQQTVVVGKTDNNSSAQKEADASKEKEEEVKKRLAMPADAHIRIELGRQWVGLTQHAILPKIERLSRPTEEKRNQLQFSELELSILDTIRRIAATYKSRHELYISKKWDDPLPSFASRAHGIIAAAGITQGFYDPTNETFYLLVEKHIVALDSKSCRMFADICFDIDDGFSFSSQDCVPERMQLAERWNNVYFKPWVAQKRPPASPLPAFSCS